MIEALGLAIPIALAVIVRRFVFRETNLAGAVGFLFTGPRPDGWPIGVQEEDRDRPWGSGGRLPAAADSEPSPTPVPVEPVVRLR